MRVFVTGATGYIGSAVVKELLKAGHQVIGLARSEASANALRSIGVDVQLGHVEDPESLKSGVAQADGVIHLGFIHDFSKYIENCEIDRRAIEAMGEVLRGTMVVASGTVLGQEGQPAASSGVMPRAATEEAVAAVVAQGKNACAVRLAPTVHGDGDKGFIPMIIQTAREKGVSGYIGNGENRWNAVHRLDAAKLFVLALEKGKAGAAYHAVGDEGVQIKTVAEVIAKQLDLPMESVGAEHFGWLGGFLSYDLPSTSQLTQAELGWQPVEVGLVEDLEKGSYF